MGSSTLVLAATCMLLARLPQASAYTGSAVCVCSQQESQTMCPTGGSAISTLTTLGEKVAGTVISAACPECWSIIGYVLPFLFPTGKLNIWQQIKAQVQSLINEDMYEAQMNNLEEKLNSFKANLYEYNTLQDKNSYAGSVQIQDLLTSVQSSVCEYIKPTTLGTDAALQISNAQFVYLASFMNLHLSVMLERNKVYAAYKPNQANDESFKSLFLGLVNAYTTLMQNTYESAMSVRRSQIIPVSETSNHGFHGNAPDKCRYVFGNANIGQSSTNYYQFQDKFGEGLVCKVISGGTEKETWPGTDSFVTCNNAETTAQSCYNSYLTAHINNANEFWYSLLTSPVTEWSNQAQAMSDKILSSAVSPSDFSFSSICAGYASSPASNASMIMV